MQTWEYVVATFQYRATFQEVVRPDWFLVSATNAEVQHEKFGPDVGTYTKGLAEQGWELFSNTAYGVGQAREKMVLIFRRVVPEKHEVRAWSVGDSEA